MHGCSLYNEYVINEAGMIQIFNLREFFGRLKVLKNPHLITVFSSLKKGIKGKY